MAKDIYTVSLRDIAPSSIASDPQIQAMIEAIDPELQGVSFDTREALIYSRIDELPEPVVDLLAWQFHVDFYEPMGMSLDVKRGLVKTAILVHKRKGTQWAVQQICDVVFGTSTVEPWHEYGGEPYHFRVTVDGSFPAPDAWEKFYRALTVTKSERDWLDAVNIVKNDELRLYYGAGSMLGGDVTTDIPVPQDDVSEMHLYHGVSTAVSGYVTTDIPAPLGADAIMPGHAGVGVMLRGVIGIYPERGVELG